MNRRVTFSVVSTFETAIKKLKRSEIEVFDCKKQGQEFIFSVNENNTQKVFAIFSKSCYNTTVLKHSLAFRIKRQLKRRCGLLLGFLLGLCLCLTCSAYVLKVEVVGSGSYLESEILRVLSNRGIIFSTSTDYRESTLEILALDNVVFCDMQKRGSVLTVLIEVDSDGDFSRGNSLVSDRDGTLEKIVAITGTPKFQVGDKVKKGDVLIDGTYESESGSFPSSVCGYAELSCSAQRQFFAAERGEESERQAILSLNIEEKLILSSSLQEKVTEGGFIYIIDFTYLHRLSINLS